jgi:hypothetical protein
MDREASPSINQSNNKPGSKWPFALPANRALIFPGFDDSDRKTRQAQPSLRARPRKGKPQVSWSRLQL